MTTKGRPSTMKGKKYGPGHGGRPPLHGLSFSRTYKSWRSAIDRCHNQNHDNYKYYGARGIVVCERWRNSFQAFLEDMGERPEGKTLDRKDTNGNYEKDNCQWSTPVVQVAGRRNAKLIEWNGEKRTAKQWSLHFGWPPHTVTCRLDNGFSIEEAMTRPIRQWVRKTAVA